MMTLDDGDDHERFEKIYRQRYARVFRFFTKQGVAHDAANDLAQETFKRLFEYMRQLRNEDEWPFLQTIAKTVLLNWARGRNAGKRKGKIVAIDDPDVGYEPPAVEARDYAEEQEHALRRRLLHDAIAQLPEGQRQCLLLWLGDLKYGEIADTLRISMDAVKSRLRDAKKDLRAKLGADDTLPEDEQ
jgi:RNA polymerase sigma factor (sigma-70 family)